MRKNPTINFCFILLIAISNWRFSLVRTVTTMRTSYTGISESSNSLSVTLKITASVFSVFRKCSVKIQWSPFNFVWWLISNFHGRFPYSVADPGSLNRARGGSPDLERGARLCSRGMSIPGVPLESPLLLILVCPILAVVLSLLISQHSGILSVSFLLIPWPRVQGRGGKSCGPQVMDFTSDRIGEKADFISCQE